MFRCLLFKSWLLLTILIFLSACNQNALLPAFYGTWTIIEHKEPGISAMNPNEIDSWIGMEIHYSKSTALLLTESCQSPTYNQKLISIQEFQNVFHFKPDFLDYTGEEIETINISCGKHDWITPGSSLIWLGREQLYMLWDGVFFRLQKQ